MPDSMEARFARMDERQISQGETLKAILAEMQTATQSRKRVYEAQERIEREFIGFQHRLDAVEKSVESIRPTTDELERVRDRVIFAGSLGKALWGAGKVLISAAAGAAAAWYSLTGRPPP